MEVIYTPHGPGKMATKTVFCDEGGFFVASLIMIGEKDCVWYVQQYGSVAEGGTSVLRIGALPVDAARSLVDESGLVSIGQLGTWDQAASDAERLELFATVASQEAIMSGPSWTNVLTGESIQWDQASGSWVVAS